MADPVPAWPAQIDDDPLTWPKVYEAVQGGEVWPAGLSSLSGFRTARAIRELLIALGVATGLAGIRTATCRRIATVR
jgi:hypothetical protein